MLKRERERGKSYKSEQPFSFFTIKAVISLTNLHPVYTCLLLGPGNMLKGNARLATFPISTESIINFMFTIQL